MNYTPSDSRDTDHIHAERALSRSPGFRAAAGTTFLLGGALFGTLLVLPLYYQVDRGESALSAGLLIAPQGIGAALMLPISGRLTDRIGGGPVVVVGCLVLAIATLPFAFVTAHTPYSLLAAVLFIRGIGLGTSIQPSAAAAYQLLRSAHVPRATALLNALRQIGGSIGTTILAVVLQHEGAAALSSVGTGSGGLLSPLPPAERARISGPVAHAFGHTFMWAFGMAVLALIPALALLRAERSGRQHQAGSDTRPQGDGKPMSAEVHILVPRVDGLEVERESSAHRPTRQAR
jgi:MFS family permease